VTHEVREIHFLSQITNNNFYLFLQEQAKNNTDTSVEDKTIPRVELSNITLTKERGTTLINKTEPILTNNESETTLMKMESEITLLSNKGSEESGMWTVMEQTLNETQTTTEKTSVSQDSNVTEQNQTDMQIRQQHFAVDAQETHKYKHNISNIEKINKTDSQRNSLLTDGKSISKDRVKEMESEQLQNISVPVDSYQKSHQKDYDTDQDDTVPKTNYLSATISPLIERKDGTVPIRIILHYPHKHHHENGTVSEHEYIVLQTGNPAYHGHLEKTVIPEQETPDKNEKGLDNADDDKHTPTRRRKGKKNHGKIKASTTGETRDTTENPEEKTAEKTHQYQHKGWKKHKSEQARDSYEEETSTEISQDIRKHGNHQNNTELSDNTIHFHRGKGRNFHKPGHHKKHKLIQIVVDDSINGMGSKEGKTKAKGHKQPQVSATEERNETNMEVTIKSTNRKNSSVESIKKDDIHKRRHGGKKISYEHHRASVTEKLNANQHPNTNPQHDSSAQQPSIPLSVVWHNAHRPTGKHNVDDDLNESNDSNEDEPDAFRPKQTDTSKTEDSQKSTVNTNDSTETNVDEANVNEQEIQGHSSHNEEHVKVSDIRKPNIGNMTDELTSSSSEDSSDSEIRGDDIIKHYSKLLKWIDYPL
jgi:hypothetical protein